MSPIIYFFAETMSPKHYWWRFWTWKSFSCTSIIRRMHRRWICFLSNLHVTGFSSWRITSMIHSYLLCVCVHVWSSAFFSAMYSFISPGCWQKTLVVPMSRQVWEAVAPPEGALLEDNCVVVSAEGDCNSNMAGRAGPQPVIDLGICQCLDAITVRSSC